MKAESLYRTVMPLALASLVFVALVFIVLSGIAWAAPEGLKTRIEIDHPVVRAGQTAEVFVLIDFEAPRVIREPGYRRQPLNVSLVIDRSGSMSAQGKLSYAKRAANMLVDRLRSEDRLGVVQYDDRIKVLWPAGPLSSPHLVKRRIDSLHPGGSTNLTGGMLKGVDQVLSGREYEQVNRVILLSDGLANQGITDPRRIATLVREARAQGVRISTMGLGLKYNEDLMQNIAESGGGNYYYIESPTQMARIFQKELQILLDTVVKEPCLIFRPSGAVRGVEVFGYQAQKEKGAYKIPMEDFFSQEKRSLLLRISLAPVAEGMNNLGDLRLTYIRNETQSARDESHPIKVVASRDAKRIKAAVNQKAKVEATLAMAEKRQAELVKEFQKGNVAVAQKGLKSLAAKLSEQNRTLDNDKLASKLEAVEMEMQQQASAQSAPAKARYLKATKARIYKAKRGKIQSYVLRKGDKGLMVERLQKALKKQGVYQGPVDGTFDADLQDSVKRFQSKNSMKQDGVAGPRTLNQLGLY
jgi:Ca-activated chloride channel family protein